MYPEVYPDNFSSDFDMFLEGGGGFLFVFYLIYMLVALAISVGTYVMQSLSLYSIADRRGIRNPWLAWLPVGDAWILGCISDQYRYVVKGRVKSKRKALLVMNILMYVAFALIFVMAFSMGLQSGGADLESPQTADMLRSALGLLALYLVLLGLAVAVTVVRYMALYDLYASCEPGNSVMYLVLSIFVSITQPIFMLVCRKKDLGMPPRKAQPSPVLPRIPQEPWTQPQESAPEPWNAPEDE